MTSRLDRLRALHAEVASQWQNEGCNVFVDGAYRYGEGPQVVASCVGAANARSIAATHNALPSLLACVDTLRALAPDHPALAPMLEEQP